LNGTVGKLLNADKGARFAKGPVLKPPHDAAWWAAKTRGFDWSDADKVAVETGDADSYNRLEWEGVKPGVPYPTRRSGADLRHRNVAKAANANAVKPAKAAKPLQFSRLEPKHSAVTKNDSPL
jgi:hypothetical protein